MRIDDVGVLLALLLVPGCRGSVPVKPAGQDRRMRSVRVARTIRGTCGKPKGPPCSSDADCGGAAKCTGTARLLRNVAVPDSTVCDGESKSDGACCVTVNGHYEDGDGGGGN